MESTLLGQDFTREIAICWGVSALILGGLMLHAWQALREAKQGRD